MGIKQTHYGIRFPPETLEMLRSPKRIVVTLYQNDVLVSVGNGYLVNGRSSVKIIDGKFHFRKGDYDWELATQYGFDFILIRGGGIRYQVNPLTLRHARNGIRRSDVPRFHQVPRKR